jgi:hypothetical protein
VGLLAGCCGGGAVVVIRGAGFGGNRKPRDRSRGGGWRGVTGFCEERSAVVWTEGGSTIIMSARGKGLKNPGCLIAILWVSIIVVSVSSRRHIHTLNVLGRSGMTVADMDDVIVLPKLS